MKRLNFDILQTSDERLGTRDANSQCAQLRSKRKRTIGIIFLSVLVTLVAVIALPAILRNTGTYFTSSKLPVNHERDDNYTVSYKNDTKNPTEQVQIKRELITNRLSWHAQPQVGPLTDFRIPVSLVIIHHTGTKPCQTEATCIYQTRHVQMFHIESNGWNEIGYNFLIGGDGAVYDGRGWKKEGVHTFGYDSKSLGVAFIGTFMHQVPPVRQIEAFLKLLDKGVELGHLDEGYKIVAARQLQVVESPGKAFFENVIKKWPNWTRKV